MVETKWQRESHFGDLLESRVCMQLIGNGFAGTDEVFGKQHVARALRFFGARCALIYVGVVFRFLCRGGGICGDNHETLRDTSRDSGRAQPQLAETLDLPGLGLGEIWCFVIMWEDHAYW